MQRQNLRYKISKIVYIVLLEISLPVDVALGIKLYDYLQGDFSTLIILLLSGILAVTLYLLYLWQMEYLTKGKHR